MLFSALTTLALAASTTAVATPVADALGHFEQRYIDSQAWAFANSTIKLIGYKRIDMNHDERDTLENAIRADPAAWSSYESRSNAFYDFAERALRIYFPVRDALVWHADQLVEANAFGEIPHDSVNGDLSVLGRYANDDVHGVPSNTVRDGMILLRAPHKVHRRRGNVHIYDFGTRAAHHHDHAHDKRGGGVACYDNHGGKICSFLPGCRVNRCAAPSRSARGCVDYNGWPITDCGGKSKKGFVGSDCSVALAKGLCWNEIM